MRRSSEDRIYPQRGSDVAIYRRILEKSPDNPEAHLGLGDSLQYLGQFDEAIAEYRRVFTDQPADTALLTKLATAYEAAGRTREAVPHLAALSSANPADTILSQSVRGNLERLESLW